MADTNEEQMTASAFNKIAEGLKEALRGDFVLHYYSTEECADIRRGLAEGHALARAEIEKRGLHVHPRIAAARAAPRTNQF